jgi:uncharacterized membrane protein
MSREVAKGAQPETLLAGLLRYGTWLASGVTVLGLSVAMAEGSPRAGAHVVSAGVALFISLPVLRVLVMLAVFVWDRDHRLAAITMIVLVTILAGFVIGIYMSNLKGLAH